MRKSVKIDVKIEPFIDSTAEGEAWGVRICFLYDSKEPDILDKRGYDSKDSAMKAGRFFVEECFKEIERENPGSTLTPHFERAGLLRPVGESFETGQVSVLPAPKRKNA